jgi:hypothetical protein
MSSHLSSSSCLLSAFRLDGYSFVYPDQWAPVTSSGNDIFLRNPFNVDQNLFVDITSPSSSRWVPMHPWMDRHSTDQQLMQGTHVSTGRGASSNKPEQLSVTGMSTFHNAAGHTEATAQLDAAAAWSFKLSRQLQLRSRHS